ncbi:sterol homeostasis protein [Coemansia sp. RSA 552]|nr:sterol homeostasis protein [Coemansia sp. RSA 552]
MTLLPLRLYAHTLMCTLSASSARVVKGVVSCNRIGCECHVLDDPQYRIVLPLITIAVIAAVALTFGPRTPQSPLMTPAAGGQVCVECAQAVDSLFTEYGAGHIRLTQCARCERFADKYVEHDVVVMFIDMLLHKPQVYRHLLVNTREFRRPVIQRNVAKLGVLLILFSVYIDWFRLEEGGRLRGQAELLFGRQFPFVAQYIFILFVAAIDAAALLGGILLASIIHQRSAAHVRCWPTIATALVISSFARVLTILLVVWDYSEAYYPWLLDLLQLTSQSTAVSVLFDINVVWAALVVVFSIAIKQLVHYVVLNAAEVLLAM